MTNVSDTEAEIANNQWKNSNATTGVGANANLRVDMTTFVASDTLAELVWSPRRGLSIKFADKEPCFMWEVGPSDIGFLRSEDEKHISEGRSVGSRAISHVSGEAAKSSSSVETTRSISHGQTGPQNQRVAKPQSEPLFEDGVTGGVMMQCGPQEHVQKETVKMDNVKKENDGCFSDPFREDAALDNKKRDEESSFNCQKNDENHDVESHGSMESCKSANISIKTKRKSSFQQQLILGSKRIKKLAHESVLKNDSSFVNWISNMLKGLKDYENYNPRIGVCDESRNTGFQNVFQSLFSQNIENKSIGSSKETDLTDKCSHESLSFLEIKKKEAEVGVKRLSLYERVTKEAPKGMFDTIRRLRLSRTDILKWTSSRLCVASLDGFFLRLRVAKWEEGEGGSKYYVACITGLQGETPWGGFKQPIRVKVGGVECFVESQYVSNCDFLEEELVAWWQKTSKTGGIPFVKDLKSKLAERKALGM